MHRVKSEESSTPEQVFSDVRACFLQASVYIQPLQKCEPESGDGETAVYILGTGQ